MTSGHFDHVAIEVAHIEQHVRLLTATGALHLIREGTVGATGQRIAMLGDGTGARVELIESRGIEQPSLAHMAIRVPEVEAARERLIANGWEPVRGPNELIAANARSALLRDSQGLHLQVISYAEGSPDREGHAP